MALPVVVTVLVGMCSLIASAALYILKRRRHFLRPGTPLFAPTGMIENMKATLTRKGLVYLRHVQNCSKSFEVGDAGITPTGATFRVMRPRLKEFFYGNSTIYTTDYKLARLLLAGDGALGVEEVEKSKVLRLLNFIDRDCDNVLSAPTTSEVREKSRKALSQSFSNSNLQKTWPHVEAVLVEQFDAFRALAANTTVSTTTATTAALAMVDIKSTMMRFFFSALFRASFAVPVNMDGEERCDSINGLKYMEEQDAVARERPRELLLPLRRLWFWDPEVRRAEAAAAYLKQQAEKVLHLHRQQQQQQRSITTTSAAADSTPSTATSNSSGSSSSSGNKKSSTLLDHLMHHTYDSELRRLSDLNIMIFGGHETTAMTFSFLIMELARNPEVKQKLQAELALVMPPLPPTAAFAATSSITNNSNISSNNNGNNNTIKNSNNCSSSVHQQHGSAQLISRICGLEYLNMCIKEVLRMWPASAGGSARDLTASRELHYEGLILPRGSSIIAHFFSIMRADWIHRTEEFIPERWSSSNCNSKNTYDSSNNSTDNNSDSVSNPRSISSNDISIFESQLPQLREAYLPFSLGRRNCIGQNMAYFQLRLVTAYFFQYFDFELMGEPTFEYFITLKPDELRCRVTERHHQ